MICLGDEIFVNELDNKYGIVPRIKINPNEKWIKHVVGPDGVRYHVLRWLGVHNPITGKTEAVVKCSEPDCVVNKPKDK